MDAVAGVGNCMGKLWAQVLPCLCVKAQKEADAASPSKIDRVIGVYTNKPLAVRVYLENRRVT